MTHRLTPARALLHPAWLVSLVVLVLNDRVWKGSGYLSGLLTGKLSDAAGMLVAPALFATLVRARTRRTVLLCHGAVIAVFAAIKLSRGAADAVELATRAVGLDWRIWVDPTDLLVAVPALVASVLWLVPAMSRPLSLGWSMRRFGEIGAGTLGLVACMGTSAEPPPMPPPQPMDTPPPVLAAPSASLSLDVLEGTWQSTGPGTPTTYRFDHGRYLFTAEFESPETGRVELVSATNASMRLRLVDCSLGKEPLPPLDLGIEVSADRATFTVADTRGIGRSYRRSPPLAAVASDSGSTAALP